MGTISRKIDHFFSKRSFITNGPCADLGTTQEDKDHLFFAIADVAGHGHEAHKLSLVIKKYLVKNHKKNLLDLMYGLHALLKGSRGAVGVAGLLTKKTGAVEYVGVGNISMRKFGKKDRRIISNEGILGYVIRTLKIQSLQLAVDDVLLLYTDGIRDYFNRSECPKGFFDRDATHIVKGIMKQFYKGNDDAACIAIRYKND